MSGITKLITAKSIVMTTTCLDMSTLLIEAAALMIARHTMECFVESYDRREVSFSRAEVMCFECAEKSIEEGLEVLKK